MANYNLREVLKQLGRNILSWVKTNCVNNCVSTATNLPLAAAQGKALQDQITTLKSNIGSISHKTISATGSEVTISGSVAISGFYAEIYTVGKIVFFHLNFQVANSNDGAWKFKLNNYPMKQGAVHVFQAFKGAGTYVPCYGTNDGYILHQGGTGPYTIYITGQYAYK